MESPKAPAYREAGVPVPIARMQKAPTWVGALEFNVAATYFPTPVRRSIIGPPSLNCRVRDGNGCDPWGIAATSLWEGSPSVVGRDLLGEVLVLEG